jgi:ATP-binding cassette subfamily C protein/ATP-binding cassette subfamily C exporter for protease/lipase/ATP-binding cassette subfamily C protein EexD
MPTRPGKATPFAAAPPTELDRVLAATRPTMVNLALFSCVLNLLMLAPSLYALQVYNRVLSTGHTETLLTLTGLVGFTLLLQALLETARSSMAARVGGWVEERIGPLFLTSGVKAQLRGESYGPQLMRDVAKLRGFISSPALTTFFDLPWAPVYLLVIWLLHPALGMLALAAAGVLVAIAVVNELLTRKPTYVAGLKQIAALQQAEAVIRNAEAVRAMGMLGALGGRWRQTSGEALSASTTVAERSAVLLGGVKFLRIFVSSAILGLGAWLVIRGDAAMGVMIAASTLFGRALAPVEQSVSAWKQFASVRLAYGRLRTCAEAEREEQPRTRLPAPAGRVHVLGTHYLPRPGAPPILRDVSFAVEPGEAVAVIGPSASGKSTLCRLLIGLHPPTFGKVKLDGSDLHHWDPEQLGRHVGYLPQDVELFAGTVRENIARMLACDDEAVIEAARLARAHEMIKLLPEGYDTQIGDGGARLSGGQRQRIGLARAVFGDPSLVVLDEPNANLDQAGESALAAAVKDLKERGVALVIVGHRPSTLAEADKVLILREGRVEFFGPREELVRMREAVAESPELAGLDARRVAEALELRGRAGERSGDSRLEFVAAEESTS